MLCVCRCKCGTSEWKCDMFDEIKGRKEGKGKRGVKGRKGGKVGGREGGGRGKGGEWDVLK